MDDKVLSDGDLLDEFPSAGVERPFEEVVRRHQRMVVGTCRRVTGNAPFAEDVAQAVFLLLARRAKSLRRRESVAAWLHVTARNMSRSALRSEGRRQERERKGVENLTTMETLSQHQREGLASLLDKEVSRLPVKYREPLLLHHLEELSPEASAERLGISVGALQMRLTRAREMLCRGLGGRNRSVSGAALVGLLVEEARAVQLAPEATEAAARVAVAISKGGLDTASGLISQTTIDLAKGELRAMIMKKCALLSAGVLVIGMAATTVLVANEGSAAAPAMELSAPVEFVAQVQVMKNTDGEVSSIRVFRSDGTASYLVKLDDKGKTLGVITSTNTYVRVTGTLATTKVDGKEVKTFALQSFSKVDPKAAASK